MAIVCRSTHRACGAEALKRDNKKTTDHSVFVRPGFCSPWLCSPWFCSFCFCSPWFLFALVLFALVLHGWAYTDYTGGRCSRGWDGGGKARVVVRPGLCSHWFCSFCFCSPWFSFALVLFALFLFALVCVRPGCVRSGFVRPVFVFLLFSHQIKIRPDLNITIPLGRKSYQLIRVPTKLLGFRTNWWEILPIGKKSCQLVGNRTNW